MFDDILPAVDKYYSDKLNKYGATSRGVDWNSIESQELRFCELSKIFIEDNQDISILDYGCGYGYFFEWLSKKHTINNIKYTGLDLSLDMINKANELYGNYNQVDFINSSKIDKKYDYIIASGIFNVKQDVQNDVWINYILNIINDFNNKACKGFSFNCLTKYSDTDKMKNYLYYADPLFLFDYIKLNHSRNVALLHDYGLYEFTVLVRK